MRNLEPFNLGFEFGQGIDLGFTSDKEVTSRDAPQELEMIGLVKERPGDFARIRCKIILQKCGLGLQAGGVDPETMREPPSDDLLTQLTNAKPIGWVSLGAEGPPVFEGPIDLKDRPLILEGRIKCEEKFLNDMLARFRDAAIAGDRFVELELYVGRPIVEVERSSPEVALQQLKAKPCGPTLSVRRLRVWWDMKLPQSPEWSRNWYD